MNDGILNVGLTDRQERLCIIYGAGIKNKPPAWWHFLVWNGILVVLELQPLAILFLFAGEIYLNYIILIFFFDFLPQSKIVALQRLIKGEKHE